jgi:type VI secretion system protein ImpF
MGYADAGFFGPIPTLQGEGATTPRTMPRTDLPPGFVPSLLDRLIDPEAGGTSWQRGYSVEEMTETIRRDLEDLLNTRRTDIDIPDDCTEVRRSLVAYGLPDLASVRADSAEQRTAIGRMLEGIIATFEPRLRNVRATLVDAGTNKDRSVKFRVEGRFRIDPAPEVVFDTVLELTGGRSTVQRGQP